MRNGVIISDEPRINDEIRVSQVRLIGPNGEQVGVIATSVALNLAKEANLDLVEVAPNAKPPVAKLIDYGKFKYNEKIEAARSAPQPEHRGNQGDPFPPQDRRPRLRSQEGPR